LIVTQVNGDRTVAIVAIITVGVVVLGLFAMIGVVAATGGDPTLVAGGVGAALGALALGITRVMSARRGNGSGGGTGDHGAAQ
jgi:amino acid transporter